SQVRILAPQPSSPVSVDFPRNVARKPAVSGLPASGTESPRPELVIHRHTAPKTSAHIRRCSCLLVDAPEAGLDRTARPWQVFLLGHGSRWKINLQNFEISIDGLTGDGMTT